MAGLQAFVRQGLTIIILLTLIILSTESICRLAHHNSDGAEDESNLKGDKKNEKNRQIT